MISALHSTGWPDGIGRLNHWLTPFTDAFVAVADSHGGFLIAEEGLPANKVVIIPNGVDTDRFAPTPDTMSVRQELAIGPTDPVIAIVAALRPEKNHELFLGVARRVVAQISNARFLIVGDGPRRAPLEDLTRELNIQDHVRYLGSRNDVPRLLSASDIFALTSHNEASPVSILEAMSVGRPIVATDVGSIREVVRDGHNGFLVAPGDAARLTERVVQLIVEPLRAQAMGEAARKTVVDGYSVDAMVHGYERLIATIYARKFPLVRSQPAITPENHPANSLPASQAAEEPFIMSVG